MTAAEGIDGFWAESLRQPAPASPPRLTPIAADLDLCEVFDVEFDGWAGDPVRAWLLLPRERSGPVPGLVHFIGYGSGRGFAHSWTLYPAAGFAVLVMDNRGQGSPHLPGSTVDAGFFEEPGGGTGFATRGITSPETYYYRRLFVDAHHAVDALRAAPGVDPERTGVVGGSQGGALALAAAALNPATAFVVAEVPFLADIPRGVALAEAGPYTEIAAFLATHRDAQDQVFDTLSHVDVALLGRRAAAPALFTLGGRDAVCPPATVRAAFDGYAGEKSLAEWAFNGHEGGGPHQTADNLRWLRRCAGLSS
ncbi:acetylxylan esterase [Microbacterium sp.]|uniref:acetylxylan esterase n=1 Tax=Microbacterium sp. TaxID=51671 RepID=UPI00333E4853